MELLLSMLIMILVSVGVYTLLQANIARIIMGLFYLFNAAALAFFVASGLNSRNAAIIESGQGSLEANSTNPISQSSVILFTVISFAVMSYLIFLCRKFFSDQSDDNFSQRSFE